MKSPRRLLDVVNDFKTGVVKLSDVRPGIRKTVQRIAGELSSEDLASYAKPAVKSARDTGSQERLRKTRTF